MEQAPGYYTVYKLIICSISRTYLLNFQFQSIQFQSGTRNFVLYTITYLFILNLIFIYIKGNFNYLYSVFWILIFKYSTGVYPYFFRYLIVKRLWFNQKYRVHACKLHTVQYTRILYSYTDIVVHSILIMRRYLKRNSFVYCRIPSSNKKNELHLLLRV